MGSVRVGCLDSLSDTRTACKILALVIGYLDWWSDAWIDGRMLGLVVGLAGVFLWRTRRRRNEGVVRHGKLSLDPSSESHNEFVAAAHYDEL